MSEKTRDEDSGLHDIRSLASSTKARLSSRRSTAHPVPTDDEIIASSSAGWKAVALPEPAKMVSLPELASLPSKAEVEAADRAARAQLKADLKADKKTAVAAPAVEAAAATPAASMSDAPSIGARIAANQKRGKGATIALVGLGVAAAAGVAIYFATANKGSAATVAAATEAPLPKAPELSSIKKELPAPPPPAAVEPPPPPPVEAVAAAAPAAPEEEPEAKTVAKKEPKEKVHKVEIRGTAGDATPSKPAAPKAVKEEVKPAGAGGEQEPSFDALLKEAGVSDQKKEVKPVLAKKSLTGSDIKAGMSSVESKAMHCYAGTQGTASVKLSVAPTGKVTKVHVTGVFANTPVGSCVENAVKSATFPPWDGGPQSIAYSYLLAE
jgi:hypothetical protein